MNSLKIGIVEDELLIARTIKKMLSELGYTPTDSSISYTEALSMIETEQPDLILLDIRLSGNKDGIDVADYLNKNLNIPFIFLTANSDMATIERAKSVNPSAFLVKPFSKDELFASIEIAFNNYLSQIKKPIRQGNDPSVSKAIFIRDHHTFQKVKYEEIIFLESEGNYVKIHTIHRKDFTVRDTLDHFSEQLPPLFFFRIGRRHIVQLELIEKIYPTEIIVQGYALPISKTFRDELYSRLGIKS